MRRAAGLLLPALFLATAAVSRVPVDQREFSFPNWSRDGRLVDDARRHRVDVRAAATSGWLESNSMHASDAVHDVLYRKDASVDVMCPVDIEPILGPTFRGFADINSELAWSGLFAATWIPPAPNAPAVPDHLLRVVLNISYCGGEVANALGCADQNGVRMAATYVDDRYDGMIWAHELGHNVKRRHRSVANALMHPETGIDNKNVNASECTSFRIER